MIRLLFLVHRYLGIAVGLLMAMWCLSGLVMMYVSYPALDQAQRIAHLAPIAWESCCRVSADALGDGDVVGHFRLEMLAGRPVLDLGDGPAAAGRVDLTSGELLDSIPAVQARSVAVAYAGGHPLHLLGSVGEDQWTLEGISPDDRPLYRFALDDRAHTQLYVSSLTGRAVQLTTRSERFWNWLGAIPHWLYFTGLRRHGWLWAQVVIYTSLIGCFLALIGLFLGVRQLVRRPPARWSPYRGFNLWHHMAGLFFGVFTLTWVLSGLLSMNPWGWLEGAGDARERAQLQGAPATGPRVRSVLQALAALHPAGVVSIESAPLNGQLFVVSTRADGRRERLDAQAHAAPLGAADRAFLVRTLGAPLTLIQQGDAYYFSHHSSPVQLPADRIVTPAGERYYLDPLSGTLLAKLDRSARGYRWWHQGLHRLDFAAIVRGRPQWDVLMWALMAGVTTVCLTGVYLGGRRLLR